MIIAVSVWNGRVSPVFDVAQNLLLIDRRGAGEANRCTLSIAGLSPLVIVETLKSKRVEMVICGAISEDFLRNLTVSGIRVEPWICGNTEEIIQALLQNKLFDQCHHMPGCCRFRGKGMRFRNRKRNSGK